MNTTTEQLKFSVLDLLSFLDKRASSFEKIFPEYASDNFVEKLLDDYNANNKQSMRKVFLDINDSFYLDDHTAMNTNDYVVPYTFSHFDINLPDYFSSQDKLVFDHNDYADTNYPTVGSAFQKESIVKVQSLGGNFYDMTTSYDNENYLFNFPTLVSIRTTPEIGVRAGTNKRVSPQVLDGVKILKNGEIDGDYKYLAFYKRWYFFSDLYFKLKKNIFFNLANPTGHSEEVKIAKKVLCDTFNVTSANESSDRVHYFIKISCSGRDCIELKQHNYYCRKGSQVSCSPTEAYISLSNKEKLVPVGGAGGVMVSCQHEAFSDKDYFANGIDFSQQLVSRQVQPGEGWSVPVGYREDTSEGSIGD